MDEQKKPPLRPHTREELQKTLEKMAELANLPKEKRRAEIERLVPTPTSPKTPRVRNTSRGLAKSDDPIYKEGWQVHLPKSAPRSSATSRTFSPEVLLATVEKSFEDALALYRKQPNQQTWLTLKEQVSRLIQMRLAAGKPISDLLATLAAGAGRSDPAVRKR